jgi:hypothetical protein
VPEGGPDASEVVSYWNVLLIEFMEFFFSGDIFNNRPPFHLSKLLQAMDKKLCSIIYCGYTIR